MDDLKKYLQAHQDELDVDTPRDAVWQRIQAQTATPKHTISAVRMIGWLSVAACLLAAIAFGVKTLLPGKIENNGNATAQIATPTATKDTQATAKTNDVPVPKKEAVKTVAEQKNDQDVVAADPNKKWKGDAIVGNANPLRKQDTQTNKHHHVEEWDPMAKELENSYAQLVNLQLGRLRATPVFAEGPDYFLAFKTQIKQMDEDEAAVRKDIKTNGMQDALLEKLINIYQQKLNVLKNLQTEINKMNNRVKQNQLPSDSSRSYFLNI